MNSQWLVPLSKDWFACLEMNQKLVQSVLYKFLVGNMLLL